MIKKPLYFAVVSLLSIALVYLVLPLAPLLAHAQTNSGNLPYTPLEPIPGITTGDLTSPGAIGPLVNAIFKVLITIGALLAVLMLTIGGVQYMISGSASEKNTGIKRAKAALWGILLIAASWLLLNTINPNLLKFTLSPCPAGSAGCTVTAASGIPTATNPVQTVQVPTNTAQQLGLQNNSAVLFTSADASNPAVAQQVSSFESSCTIQGASNTSAQLVSGTVVGGTAQQSAYVCGQPTTLQLLQQGVNLGM